MVGHRAIGVVADLRKYLNEFFMLLSLAGKPLSNQSYCLGFVCIFPLPSWEITRCLDFISVKGTGFLKLGASVLSPLVY